MPHEIATFRGGEEPERRGHQRADLVEGTGACGAQERFQFRKRQLDRIEVGAIRREKPQLGADSRDRRVDLWVFVDGEVVEDDHVARP